MPNPSTRWNAIPVWGIFLKGDDVTPVTGSVRLTLTQRITRVDGRIVYPEGAQVERIIGETDADPTTRDAVRAAWRAADEAAEGLAFDGAAWDARWNQLMAGAVFASFPASDDPDIIQTGYQVKVEERLSSGAGKIYYVEPLLAHLDRVPPGINLGLIDVPPGSPTAPAPIYAKGLPGGVAALSLEGQVLDAAGNVVGSPDLTAYVTDTELSERLATKVNSSTYTAGLAGKGDLAGPNTWTGTQDFAGATVTGIAAGGGGATNTITGLVAGDPTAAAANSAALASFVADTTRGPLLSFATPGAYYFDGEMNCTNLTNPLREVYLGEGVELVQNRATTSSASRAYGPTFRGLLERTTPGGSDVKVRFFTANANRHSTTITLDDVTGIRGEGPDEVDGSGAEDMLAPGTVLYLCSDDLIHTGGKYRNAALVQVVTKVGNTLTLDRPLYRNWTTANFSCAVVVDMHPSVFVHGPGRIRHVDPWANGTFYASLLRFEFCQDITVAPEVKLGPGPGSGIDLMSVWGFDVRPQTSYLLSDDAIGNDADTWHPSNLLQVPHYGYGVAVGGATRDGFVGGSSHHIRHAFTTMQSPDVLSLSSINSAVTTAGGVSPSRSNCGDPEFITVKPRVWSSWQQAIDTHEAGHDLTVDLSGVDAGTWDDTIEEAQPVGVNIRSADTTVTGRLAGGGLVGVILAFQSLANPEFGMTRLENLRIGPTPEAVRINSGVGSRLVMNGVRAYGCKQLLRVRGSNPHHITGEGNFADGTGVAEDSAKRIVFADSSVPGTSWIDIGVDYVNYTDGVVNYSASGLSQANTVVRRSSDRGRTTLLYNGTAWPATRPQVPAGRLELVSALPDIPAPTWLLDGDTYETATS